MSRTPTARHYNPDWLDDDALLAGFVARQRDFEFLRAELAGTPLQGSVQHHLLVGQRGAGKTTLLKRLAVAIRRDADLQDHLVALSFPEELYQVKSLDDFWWAACEALGEELALLGLSRPAAQLLDAVDAARTTATPVAGEGLARLLAACTELGRRPVMLVDNLDLVIQRIESGGRAKYRGPQSTAYWAFREALSTASSPVVIGTSVRLSEPFSDYDKAFYDFFLPMRLGKLPLAEVRTLLERLADRHGSPEVKARLAERPARVAALYELTGGNPRAASLIFELLASGPGHRAVDDFERLLDLTTPYYKARFEDLPAQAQVVMHALAVRRRTDGQELQFGHTAAELGAHAGLPTNTVSAQLEVLLRDGLVEKSTGPGRTQYRIAEQLFRLWLQMRGSRRIRQMVVGLAEFLESWFDVEELTTQLSAAGGRTGALLSFAVAETRGAAAMRHGLSAAGAERLLEYTQTEGEAFDDYFVRDDLPEDIARLVALRRQLKAARNTGLSVEEQEALLGSVTLRQQDKAASVAALCQPADAGTEVTRLRSLLTAERQRLIHAGLQEADLPLFFRLRARGMLPLPALAPGDIEAAYAVEPSPLLRPMAWRLVGAFDLVRVPDDAVAAGWLAWGRAHAQSASSADWANVARAFRRSRRFAAAAEALDEAFKRGESPQAWTQRGALISETGGAAEAAERALRRALELAPGYARAWSTLASLQRDTPGGASAAEASLCMAIELDPADSLPWWNLGVLLFDLPDRVADAEAAFRRAAELDPTDALIWNNLALTFARQGRTEDAEDACRKAIALDPGAPDPWFNLGNLLFDRAGRDDEAEAAYRQAVALGPTEPAHWNNLGNALVGRLGRQHEAEAAYRQAIALKPDDAVPWLNLGNLLGDALDRKEEAEAALRKAIELAPPDAASAALPYLRRARARLLAIRLRRALSEGGADAARDVLAERPEPDDGIAALAAQPSFSEELLVPTLAHRAAALERLQQLRQAGFDAYAGPLMAAFQAAIDRREDALDSLDPELRNAAKSLYAQLLAEP